MAIFRKERPPRISREQALGARPVRNPGLEPSRAENGEVSLKIPRRKVWWVNWFAKFGSFPEYRLLILDTVGSRIWELCDGEHCVGDLVDTLAREHQLSRKEAEISMMTYLGRLAERGVIALVVQKEKKDGEESPDSAGSHRE